MDFSDIQHVRLQIVLSLMIPEDESIGLVSGRGSRVGAYGVKGKTGQRVISDEEFNRRAWKKRPA